MAWPKLKILAWLIRSGLRVSMYFLASGLRESCLKIFEGSKGKWWVSLRECWVCFSLFVGKVGLMDMSLIFCFSEQKTKKKSIKIHTQLTLLVHINHRRLHPSRNIHQLPVTFKPRISYKNNHPRQVFYRATENGQFCDFFFIFF